MFANFIYFIIALLEYLSYLPNTHVSFNPEMNTGIFLGLLLVFWLVTQTRFKRFERKLQQSFPARFDFTFDNLVKQQSILAIIIFAIDIHFLHLPDFLEPISLFKFVPTLGGVFFMAIFLGYLVIIWACAHEAHQRIFNSTLSRKTYLLSNISFAIPILLPWFLLSLFLDLIRLLPFNSLNRVLDSDAGQIGFLIFFLILVAIIGPSLIQRLWRCRPLENGVDRQRIEDLCQRAGVGYRNILYWPIFGGQMITAGVMGLIKKYRYILVTQGLLQCLAPHEIEAVIAHEIGHVKKKHLVFYLFFFVGLIVVIILSSTSLLGLLSYLILLLANLFGIAWNVSSNSLLTSFYTITELACIILPFVLYFRYIFGYFMRNFERQADTFVYELFNSADALISTFEKIAMSSGQSPDKPNWHHFSIAERIAFLKRCELDRTEIKKHEGKLKNSLIAYVIGLLLLGGMWWQISFGYGKQFLINLDQANLEQQLALNPENNDLMFYAANYYHEHHQYQKAIAAYTRFLTSNPDQAEALNGLAWLYATCEEPAFRNPEKALRLARKAVRLKRIAPILDTLAESYYVNGNIAKAISTENEALKLANEDRHVFEAQLKKYEKALSP